ncbi:hypothetical protein MPSEU_000572900 [Mayamaea pseudoterrestris]|nr:hypothetical protein MPSEU_000572900 [Mayamaea pseudoterrestris]
MFRNACFSENHADAKQLTPQDTLHPLSLGWVSYTSVNAMMLRLKDRVRPGVSRRDDFPLVPHLSALLIVDIQKYLSDEHDNAVQSPAHSSFVRESLPRAIDNIQRVADLFRLRRDNAAKTDKEQHSQSACCGCEVMWTYLQARTRDCRDISLDYKLSGPALANIPGVDVTLDQLFLDYFRPNMTSGKGDILLPKTSCSVFQSTNLDYVLRNLGIEQLVIVGQLTDQCIEGAVRDAADLGFFVTVIHDACAAQSPVAHEKGIESMKGFARIVSTMQVLQELQLSAGA